MMFRPNEGKIDRVARTLIGIVLALGADYKLDGTPQIIAFVISAILVLTATTGFCFLYKLFGISTKKQ